MHRRTKSWKVRVPSSHSKRPNEQDDAHQMHCSLGRDGLGRFNCIDPKHADVHLHLTACVEKDSG